MHERNKNLFGFCVEKYVCMLVRYWLGTDINYVDDIMRWQICLENKWWGVAVCGNVFNTNWMQIMLMAFLTIRPFFVHLVLTSARMSALHVFDGFYLWNWLINCVTVFVSCSYNFDSRWNQRNELIISFFFLEWMQIVLCLNSFSSLFTITNLWSWIVHFQ